MCFVQLGIDNRCASVDDTSSIGDGSIGIGLGINSVRGKPVADGLPRTEFIPKLLPMEPSPIDEVSSADAQ